jgi:hypothetical protein
MLRLVIALAIIVLRPVGALAQIEAASRVGEEAAKSVIGTGPMGAIFILYVVLSGVVIAALWKKGRDGDALIKDLQEKRLADTANYIEKIARSGSEISTAITGNNAQVADLARLFNAMFDLLKTVPPAVGAVKEDVGTNRQRVDALNDFLRDKLGGAK